MGKEEPSQPEEASISKVDFPIKMNLPFFISSRGLRSSVRYYRDGHWSQKEKLKYVVFLDHFKSLLTNPAKKKQLRVYQMMSDMILTRNPNQCRSHHQKMQNYQKEIVNIINTVASKYEPNTFHQISSRYQLLIRELLDNWDKYQRSLSTSSSTCNENKRPKSTRIRLLREELRLRQAQGSAHLRKEALQSQQSPPVQDRKVEDRAQKHITRPTEVKPKVQEQAQPQIAFQPFPQPPFQFGPPPDSLLSPQQQFQMQVQRCKKLKDWYMHNAQLYYEHWKHQMNLSSACEKRIAQLYRSINYVGHYRLEGNRVSTT